MGCLGVGWAINIKAALAALFAPRSGPAAGHIQNWIFAGGFRPYMPPTAKIPQPVAKRRPSEARRLLIFVFDFQGVSLAVRPKCGKC